MKTDFVEFTCSYKLPDGTSVFDFDARATANVVFGQPAYTPRGEYAPTDPPTDDMVKDYTDIQVEVFVRLKTAEERQLTGGAWVREWREPDAALLAQIINHLTAGAEDDRFLDDAAEQLAYDAELRADARRERAGGAA